MCVVVSLPRSDETTGRLTTSPPNPRAAKATKRFRQLEGSKGGVGEREVLWPNAYDFASAAKGISRDLEPVESLDRQAYLGR